MEGVIQLISPQEYLRFERNAKEKHEYFEGKIIAMAGASLAQGRIISNLVCKIGNYVKHTSCEILPNNIRA